MKTIVRLYRTKIITIMLTSVLLIAAVDIGGIIGIETLENHIDVLINGNTLPISQLNELRAAELDARRLFWMSAVLRDSSKTPEVKRKFDADMDTMGTQWRAYYPAGVSSPHEETVAEALRQTMPQFKSALAAGFDQIESGNYANAVEWYKEQLGLFDQFDLLIADAISTNVDQSLTLVTQSKAILKAMSWTVLTFLSLCVAATAAIAVLLSRQRENAVVESRYQAWLTNRVFELTFDALMVTDGKGKILRVNPAFTDLTGYAPTEAVGRTPKILNSGRQSADFYRDFWQTLKTKGQWKGQLWNRRKGGDLYLESLTIAGVRDSDGKFSHYVAVMSDITQRFHQEERMSHLATHDALTGLPNRMLFNERIKQAISRAKRNGMLVAIMYIDLDGFKQINDTYGHSAGDDVLRVVADRLKDKLRESDTVARLGGDEFAVVLEDISEASNVESIAASLVASVGVSIPVEGHYERVTSSIGVGIYPENAVDAERLIQTADHAMYLAKKSGKNAYRISSEQPQTQSSQAGSDVATRVSDRWMSGKGDEKVTVARPRAS